MSDPAPTPAARLNAYRNAVTATIASRLPELRSCESQLGRFDLDELEKQSFRGPAVRVAVLRARTLRQAQGNVDAALECAAFIVTEGKDRDDHAWTIGEAIAVMLEPSQLFGIYKMSAPTDVLITPLASAPMKARGVSLLAVEWKQELRGLGDGIWDAENQLLSELYVNDDPVDLEEGEDDQP